MTNVLNTLVRRQVRHRDVGFRARGFPPCDADVRDYLEARAHAFVTGAHAFGQHSDQPHAALVEAAEPDLRGFAYEGAGMVAAMADLLALGRGRHLQRLLSGEGRNYRHLAHVGAGWGLSVTRWPRPTALRGIDPLLRWLALDGRGFHRAYFTPQLTLAALHGLDDSEETQLHAAGVGRALWFTRGADLPRIAVDIAVAPPGLQPSMWSGVGLAACYAGRPGAVDGAELRDLAGPAAPHVGQGVVFALAARAAHGLPSDTGRQQLAGHLGVRADGAAELAERTCADLVAPGAPVTAMLTWRARLAQQCRQSVLVDVSGDRTADA